MKTAIITDTHFGVRNDNEIIAKNTSKFFHEIFWPTIDKHEIKTILHLGDFFDRRKYINWLTSDYVDRDFINPLIERDVKCHMIVGNHDTYFKDTNRVNGPEKMYGGRFPNNLFIYSDPTELAITESTSLAMFPWICEDNYDETFEFMKNTNAQIAMGHFAINGFDMYRGATNEGGLSTKLFNKFDMTFSGHFHHKSKSGSIHYLGAPYEMTWSDFDDPRGFHLFEPDARKLTFVKNTSPNFVKVWYNDEDMSIEDLRKLDFSYVEDTYVKLIVSHKENSEIFSMFQDRLNSCFPAGIQIVEDHHDDDQIEPETLIDESESTVSIIKKYVSNIDHKSVAEVEELMLELYQEAIDLQ